MRLRLRQQWQVLFRGKPGHRFHDRYHAHRRKRTEQGVFRRLGRIVLALVATLIAVVLVFIPGPAILFFFIAGALLAVEWLWLARQLDWLEVKLRAGWKRALAFWRRLHPAGKIALVATGVILAGAAAYGAYRWFFS